MKDITSLEKILGKFITHEQIAALTDEIARGISFINGIIDKNEKTKAKKELIVETFKSIDKMIGQSEKLPYTFKMLYGTAKTKIHLLLEPIITKIVMESDFNDLDDIPDVKPEEKNFSGPAGNTEKHAENGNQQNEGQQGGRRRRNRRHGRNRNGGQHQQQAGTMPETLNGIKPETVSETLDPAPKPEPEPEQKTTPKPEVKPEQKPVRKPEPKPVQKPEPKPVQKPAPKQESKPEPGSRSENKPAPKPAGKQETEPEPKPAAEKIKRTSARKKSFVPEASEEKKPADKQQEAAPKKRTVRRKTKNSDE